MRFLLLMVALSLVFSGCARQVPLGEASANTATLSYDDVKKLHTATGRLEWDGGGTDFYATILHTSMRKFRVDIPTEGTGIEFSTTSPIAVKKYTMTIDINNKIHYVVSGLGTENIRVNGDTNSSFSFKPMKIRNDLTEVYSFVLYMPYVIDSSTKTIQITGESSEESKFRFYVKINFLPDGSIAK